MSDNDPSRYLSDILFEAIDNDVLITDVCHISDTSRPMSAGRVIGRKPNGERYGPHSITKEKRGVVCIDIVVSTKNTNIEQCVKVAILYKYISKTVKKLSEFSNPIRPELFIPAGDGGYLVYANDGAQGVLGTIAFPIHFLSEIGEHNKKSNEITKFDIRLSATWGDVIPVNIPLSNTKNILGDAINECARIGAQRKFKGMLLISEQLVKAIESPLNNTNNFQFVNNMKIADAGKELIGLQTKDIIQYECLGECEVKNWKGIVYKVFGEVEGIPIG